MLGPTTWAVVGIALGEYEIKWERECEMGPAVKGAAVAWAAWCLPAAAGGVRGLHSCTVQLNVSTFCVSRC